MPSLTSETTFFDAKNSIKLASLPNHCGLIILKEKDEIFLSRTFRNELFFQV